MLEAETGLDSFVVVVGGIKWDFSGPAAVARMPERLRCVISHAW